MSDSPSTAAPTAPSAAGSAPAAFVGTRERVRGRAWPIRALGWFSSVRSAAALIALLAIVIGGATAYESVYGRDVAAVVIYQSWWFAAIFVALAVNIFGAAAVRYPWRRHQIGFVIVHAGLLLLILGFFLAGNDRLDGALEAYPGKPASVMELPQDQITVEDTTRVAVRFQPLAFAGYPSFGRFLLAPLWPVRDPGINRLSRPETLLSGGDQPTVRVLAACDTARAEAAWVVGSGAGAAPAARIGLAVRTPMMPMGADASSHWLSLAGERVLSLGPLMATLSSTASARMAADFIAAAPVTAARGQLSVYWRDQRYGIAVAETLPQTVDLAPDLSVVVAEYLPNPRVVGDQLTQDGDSQSDPFVSVRVGVGAEGARTWHPMKLSAYYLLPQLAADLPALLYEHPQQRRATPGTQGAFCQLLAGPDARLYLRWFTRSRGFGGAATIDSLWSGDLVGGEGMPMQVHADIAWLPKAVPGPEPVRMNPDRKDLAARWIEFEVERGGHRGRAWLARRSRTAVILDDGSQVLIAYDKARYSLLDHHGFALRLEHFDEGTDPGGQSAASYASDVTVVPMDDAERARLGERRAREQEDRDRRFSASRGGRLVPAAIARWLRRPEPLPPPVAPQRALISMNEPLDVAGVTIYQTSFFPEQDDDGVPTGRSVSTFTVAQDRGRWFKYLGSAVLVSGIITMYLLRRRPPPRSV
jgi:hypothetical protein